jgi:hypothetical protein
MSEPLTLETLKKRLGELQASRIQLEANLQAQNGAIQFCQHLIAQLEAEAKIADKAAPAPESAPNLKLVEKE